MKPEDKETIYSGHKHREMLKFSAIDAFSQIIDDIYEEKQPYAEKARLYFLCKELLTTVQREKEIIGHPVVRDVVEKLIINMQKQMALIDEEYLLVKLTPEEIISNIDLLLSELLLV